MAHKQYELLIISLHLLNAQCGEVTCIILYLCCMMVYCLLAFCIFL